MLRSAWTLGVFVLVLATTSACFEDTDLPDGLTDATTNNDDSEAGSTDTSDTGQNEASCENYCNFQSACDNDFPQYSTVGPCLSVCEKMPLGTMTDMTGNTVGCRTFYAIEAGENTADQETNCRRAGPSGDGACGGICESFCAIAQQACVDDNEAFSSTVECLDACELWNTEPNYDANVPEADTYACRLKHLTYATVLPGTHCSHVAAVSPVCM